MAPADTSSQFERAVSRLGADFGHLGLSTNEPLGTAAEPRLTASEMRAIEADVIAALESNEPLAAVVAATPPIPLGDRQAQLASRYRRVVLRDELVRRWAAQEAANDDI